MAKVFVNKICNAQLSLEYDLGLRILLYLREFKVFSIAINNDDAILFPLNFMCTDFAKQKWQEKNGSILTFMPYEITPCDSHGSGINVKQIRQKNSISFF